MGAGVRGFLVQRHILKVHDVLGLGFFPKFEDFGSLFYDLVVLHQLHPPRLLLLIILFALSLLHLPHLGPDLLLVQHHSMLILLVAEPE